MKLHHHNHRPVKLTMADHDGDIDNRNLKPKPARRRSSSKAGTAAKNPSSSPKTAGKSRKRSQPSATPRQGAANDPDEILYHIHGGDFVRRKDEQLVAASARGDLAGVQFWVRERAWICVETKAKETPTMVASRYGHTRVLRYLIEHGGYVNGHCSPDEIEGNPLLWAVFNQHWEAAAVLLESDHVDTEITTWADGNTPLHFAVAHGAPITLLERLLDRGADPTTANFDGETPLDWAHVRLEQFNNNDDAVECNRTTTVRDDGKDTAAKHSPCQKHFTQIVDLLQGVSGLNPNEALNSEYDFVEGNKLLDLFEHFDEFGDVPST